MREKTEISEMVISRLPLYLQTLRHLAEEGQTVVRSHFLGVRLGISAAQIRKDLSLFGEFGKQGTGYDVAKLIQVLSRILNSDRVWDMAVIGAGNIGRAVAHYQGFTERGFRVAMIFDNDPQKIGTKIASFTIRDAADMVTAIRQCNIRIALLTVPAGAAQKVTNQLVEAGVKAILNYAPITVNVPPGVHIQYYDPVVFLQQMTYYL